MLVGNFISSDAPYPDSQPRAAATILVRGQRAAARSYIHDGSVVNPSDLPTKLIEHPFVGYVSAHRPPRASVRSDGCIQCRSLCRIGWTPFDSADYDFAP